MKYKYSLLILVFILLSFVVKSETIVNDSTKTPEKETLIKKVENWYSHNINYANITLLMVVESSFIPFPSEIVIPPAAYIASKPESKLNIFLVVLFGTLGALMGAYINYFLALWLGRPLIYKFADSKVGHFLLLSGEKVEKAEKYFIKHGNSSTFVGRLIPGIRQLISIPAGLARMNFLSFSFYTALGALIWNTVLALLGYIAHGQSDLIDKYSKELSVIILVILGAAVLFFIIKRIIKKKRKK